MNRETQFGITISLMGIAVVALIGLIVGQGGFLGGDDTGVSTSDAGCNECGLGSRGRMSWQIDWVMQVRSDE